MDRITIRNVQNSRSIGTFANYLGLDFLHILESDLTFKCRRNENITFALQNGEWVQKNLGFAKPAEGTLLGTMLEDTFNVQTVGVVGSHIMFANTNDFCTVRE